MTDLLKAKIRNCIWPFGKYEGDVVEDLPEDYVEWAVDNLDESPARLILEIFLEIKS